MFGDAYDTDPSGVDRPKYGNLNLLTHVAGDRTAAHYGQSYLVFNRNVRPRISVTHCDSSKDTAKLGTLSHFAHVLLAAIERCGSVRARQLMTALDYLVLRPGAADFPPIDPKFLDTYIEVQIHGDLLLARDVGEVVVHPDEATSADMKGHLAVFRERYSVDNGGALRRVVRFTKDGGAPTF